MDSKDLRIEPPPSGRNNDGNKYGQSSDITLQCDRNKSYQDIGSNSLAKVEVQNVRPCAVIGPDRVVPPTVANEAYLKKGPPEPWSCVDNTYRRPPEYPHKLSNYQSPLRNISPRQTFQENMQRIMVPPTYNSIKINDDTNNYAQISDRNVALSKNIKLNVPSEAKYCDVPYAVNLNSSEQKSVRNPETCVSSVNSPVIRTSSHGWPSGSANLRSARSYGAPELYQYQDYPSCAGPRPVVPRPHRNITEESGYVYTDPFYPDGNIRFKPYPTAKDRFPQARYDYIGNYPNSFHPPPFPSQKYELQKSMPHHPFPPYTPIKYLDSRVSEPILDGYQRNQQGTMTFHNQVVHPNFGTIVGNCTSNKMPYPPENSSRTNVPNKTHYDNNNKTYDFDNSRTKIHPPSDAYFVNEMARLHPMRSQVLMPNYANLNMHTGPYNPYYKKDNAQIKNFEYMSHYRNLDPAMNIHNPMMRYPPLFSPNTLAISPTDSSANNDPNQSLGLSQEDCGYVNQSSSVRSIDHTTLGRIPNDYYRRYYDSRYGHLARSSGMMVKNELHSNNNSSKEKKNIDVRQFLQMWNEGDDETEDSNPKEIIIKTGSSDDKKITKTHEAVNNQEQLYVLGLVNVPNEELSKYEHIQTVSKLPENIKGYNSIELLDQFEEAIESSNINKFKPQTFNENFHASMKEVNPKQVKGILPRPISPLDVEAKISQSVIHKEVGCNFEIKPCSPKMLNVEVTTPVQSILAERVIEKVVNPAIMKSPILNGMEQNRDCNIMKRQDLGLNMGDSLRIPSCKMINNQFSNMSSMDSIKSSYSLHDLESNSGLCLASLPRLDNDIELNFPEVNQQFINANKGEPKSSISALKDLPKLDVFNQSNNEITHKDDIKMSVPPNNQYLNAIKQTYKNQQTPSNTDSEKEFSKLSKFRKNKTNMSEEFEKKTLLPEDQVQSKNVIRTDSVIIKNPENTKKYDETPISSPNCFNELQETPMNLTSQVNFDTTQKENDVNNDCNESIKESEYTPMAIDFSLNKNHLFRDLKHTQMESIKEADNVELKDDKLVIPCKEIEDKVIFDFNSEINNPIQEFNTLNQTVPEKNINYKCKKNANKTVSEESINTECNIKSEKREVGFQTILKDNCSLLNGDSNYKDPLNELDSKKNSSPNNIDLSACELRNKDNIRINQESIACNTDSSERKLESIILSQAEAGKEIQIKNVRKHGYVTDTGLVNSVQNKMCEQSILISEMCSVTNEDCEETDLINKMCNSAVKSEEINGICVSSMQTKVCEEINRIEMVSPIQNLNVVKEMSVKNEDCEQSHVSIPCTSTLQHSPTRRDIDSNQFDDGLSKEPLDTRQNSPSAYSVAEPETEKNIKLITADCTFQDSEIKVKENNYLMCDRESVSKGTIQCLRIWSKEMFSPWIRKLLTFSEGNINIVSNLKMIDKDSIASKLTDKDLENTLNDNKNLNDFGKKDKDLKVFDNENIVVSTAPKSDVDLKFIPKSNNDKQDIINCTDKQDIEIYTVKEKHISDDNELSTSVLCPNVESTLEDDKDRKELAAFEVDTDVSNDQTTVLKDREIISNTGCLLENNDLTVCQDTTSAIETLNTVSNEVKNDTEIPGLSDPICMNEICNPLQKGASEVSVTIPEIVVENKENTNNKIDDSIFLTCEQRRPLKRSLSDSALNAYGVNKKNNIENVDDIQMPWPLKRKKIENLENINHDILTQNLCSIIQHNRRNSLSAICTEDNVSFCILIDDSCIIADEENEEQKICYTELSEDIHNETVNDEVEDNIVVPTAQNTQMNAECEYSDSFTFDCEEKILENSWVEDVACIETVISDDIAENIVISGPSSPKEAECSDNDESGVFSSSEHTDKVKFIYGNKMCSDDALYLEKLYNTPQMNVNKTLNKRETQVVDESSKYYDNDSLEKILSESNGKESSTTEFMHSILLLDVTKSNTPDDKENMNIEQFSAQNKLNSGDNVEHGLHYIDEEIIQPKLSFCKPQDDNVHSCESSIDNVFSYTDNPKEDSNYTSSSSPEVSSTTSEEKGSSILLKITNYKGSRISQINKISSVINRPSCKFTEVNDYLQKNSNISNNRPLLTKAAQKYIPPIKESIRDLKVKLTLPQHSLMKLKQLKQSKDEPKPAKQNTNIFKIQKKPKPKFEDVLMSIDEIQFQKHKEKTKKTKKAIPKVVIKKSQSGSHYASTSNKEEYNPDLTGRKWQPWVFLEKNHFIDKMAFRKKTKAVYSHRKKCFVLLEKFKKYKSVNNTKFVISQPKTDNSSSGLKYTIRLKHNY